MSNYYTKTSASSKIPSLISFNDVDVVYDHYLKVLKDITFKVERGDLLFVVGPNGAGKSSLIKLITKEIKPYKGTLKLNTKKVGYLPQRSFELSHIPITVYEVIYSGLNKYIYSFMRKEKVKIDAWLDKLGLNNLGNKSINELSGGQRQRVFLIRALINNPDLLILDEPTSSLDKEYRKAFYDLVFELNKKGMTIITVTHDLDEAFKDNGNILALDEKIIYYGPTKDYLEIGDHHV